MEKARLKTVIVLACGTLLLAGCRRGNSPEGPKQGIRDSALVSQIEAKFWQNAALKTGTIHVAVQQGVVTLSGEVVNDSERLSAEKLAGGVGGVKQVIDLLNVAVARSAPPQPPTENSTEPEPSEKERPSEVSTQLTQRRTSNLPPVVQEPPAGAAQQPAQNVAPVVEEPPSKPTQQKPLGVAPVVNVPPSLPPPPPAPAPVTVLPGTNISVRMIDSIDSANNQAGQTFAASVSGPIAVGEQVVIPQGADARVRLEEDQSAGHFKGRSLLKVELVSVTAYGKIYNLETDPVEKEDASRGKNTAEKVGGGAAAGTVIGVILGRGKGAGIGAAIGAAGGAVDQGLTHAKSVKVASEERLDFVLRSPLTVQMPAARSMNP